MILRRRSTPRSSPRTGCDCSVLSCGPTWTTPPLSVPVIEHVARLAHRRAGIPQTSHRRTSGKDCLRLAGIEDAVKTKAKTRAIFWRTNQPTTEKNTSSYTQSVGLANLVTWLDSVSLRWIWARRHLNSVALWPRRCTPVLPAVKGGIYLQVDPHTRRPVGIPKRGRFKQEAMLHPCIFGSEKETQVLSGTPQCFAHLSKPAAKCSRSNWDVTAQMGTTGQCAYCNAFL